jgi:hypothetical protein
MRQATWNFLQDGNGEEASGGKSYQVISVPTRICLEKMIVKPLQTYFLPANDMIAKAEQNAQKNLQEHAAHCT